MNNFIESFKNGQKGKNKGLYLGPGLDNISKAINGVQRHRIYTVASPPKTGKSTFVDYGFVISPYLDWIENNPGIEIEWVYFSFEIDRVSKEFDFVAYFLYHDFGIERITLEEGQTITINNQKETVIDLSPDYLRGRLQDDNGNIIKVKESIVEAIKVVYEKRIIPLFGEYSSSGTQITPGKINFIENRDNPTGIWKYLIHKAEKEGDFIYEYFGENKKRIRGYKPLNPDKITIVVLDHIRKCVPERGFNMKQTVDKMSEMLVELRNLLSYTFVIVIHSNRNIADTERLKFAKDELYIQSEDLKDSGNLNEDSDFVLSMFNPNDDRYHLTKHFGMTIKDRNNNPIYPNLRTIHLIESRHCLYPQHFKTNMRGNLKTFEQIKT